MCKGPGMLVSGCPLLTPEVTGPGRGGRADPAWDFFAFTGFVLGQWWRGDRRVGQSWAELLFPPALTGAPGQEE